MACDGGRGHDNGVEQIHRLRRGRDSITPSSLVTRPCPRSHGFPHGSPGRSMSRQGVINHAPTPPDAVTKFVFSARSSRPVCAPIRHHISGPHYFIQYNVIWCYSLSISRSRMRVALRRSTRAASIPARCSAGTVSARCSRDAPTDKPCSAL